MTAPRRLIACSTFLLCLFWCAPSPNAEPTLSSAGGEALHEKYLEIKPKLERNEFGVPLYCESIEEEDSLRGDVYGIIEHPFAVVEDVLLEPRNWCDIASLHFNIKACTCRNSGNGAVLVLYTGRKFYQPLEDTYQVNYEYQSLAHQSAYLMVSLKADEGPLNTKDCLIELESIPLEGGKALIHFSYAYTYGALASMAMKAYFRTLAREKVGFSVIHFDGEGNAVHVGGTRGAMERNAVRYYLALQAYMDTIQFPEGVRFQRRLSRWYDLTDQHRRQLFEMSKEEYLTNKKKERESLLLLQGKV
jgi:hypothetical protein